jgi:hypothetical protein
MLEPDDKQEKRVIDPMGDSAYERGSATCVCVCGGGEIKCQMLSECQSPHLIPGFRTSLNASHRPFPVPFAALDKGAVCMHSAYEPRPRPYNAALIKKQRMHEKE